MEEEKAVAYYDELTRKGGGAARFKQGLGFSSQNDDIPSRASGLPSSTSSLSNFVRASSPGKALELQKQLQLENIQNKLKKSSTEQKSSTSNEGSRKSSHRRRSSSRDRDSDRHSRRRSRSRDRDELRRDSSSSRERAGHLSRRSRSRDRDISRRNPSSCRERRRYGDRGRTDRSRSRSSSPKDRKLHKSRGNGAKDRMGSKVDKERSSAIDYSRLIDGYEKMSPAERVKAKMKLQLSETVEKDAHKGMGSGWERFEFDKDAPLDDDEIEAGEDDAVLVKQIGQSFRFSAVEARREEEIKAAHDAAMFGPPLVRPSLDPKNDDIDEEDNRKDGNISVVSKSSDNVTNLISDKVLAKQQGSWRDRARKT